MGIHDGQLSFFFFFFVRKSSNCQTYGPEQLAGPELAARYEITMEAGFSVPSVRLNAIEELQGWGHLPFREKVF